MAWMSGRGEDVRRLLGDAIARYEEAGLQHAAARASARIGEVEFAEGRADRAVERMERAFAALADEPLDEDTAMLVAQLGRVLFFVGRVDDAADRIEQALDAAEALQLPEVLAQALITKSLVMGSRMRREESGVLLGHALQVALDHELPQTALRAYRNMGANLEQWNRYEEELELVEQSADLARRYGDRLYELAHNVGVIGPLIEVGRWDDALDRLEAARQSPEIVSLMTVYLELLPAVFVYCQRGELDEAERLLQEPTWIEESEDLQAQGLHHAMRGVLERARGHHDEALAEAVAGQHSYGGWSQWDAVRLAVMVESSLALGDVDGAADRLGVVEAMPPGHVPPALRAQWSRLTALAAAASGAVDRIEQGFKAGAGLFRELGMPFWLAVTLLEHGEWLTAAGRTADAAPFLEEAAEIFERLRARPWLDRMRRDAPELATAATDGGIETP
jgi:tetratricopeptide (TPR) repeat protein